jgi:hypothetical protein
MLTMHSEGDVMKKQLLASILLSIVLGIAQTAMVFFLWSFIVIYSPVVHWCLALHLHHTSIHTIVNVTDFLINVALSLPAAFALIKLRPPNLGLYLLLAVLPSFTLINYHIPDSDFLSGMWLAFIPGWVNELAALPVAAYLLRAIMKPDAPSGVLQHDARIPST